MKAKKKLRKIIESKKRAAPEAFKACAIQPGEVRNPYGRPRKEHCITDWLRRIGHEHGSFTFQIEKGKTLKYNNITKYEAFARMMWWRAQHQMSDYAAKEILERLEGKVTQPISSLKGSVIAIGFDEDEMQIESTANE